MSRLFFSKKGRGLGVVPETRNMFRPLSGTTVALVSTMILHAIKDYQTGRQVLVKFEGLDNVQVPYTKLRAKWNRQAPARITLLSEMLRERIDGLSGSAHSDADETDSDEDEFAGGVDDLLAEQARSGAGRKEAGRKGAGRKGAGRKGAGRKDAGEEEEEWEMGGEVRRMDREAETERMGQDGEMEMGGGEEAAVGEDEEAAVGGDEEAAVGGDEEAAVGGDEEAAVGGDEEAAVSGDEEAAVSGDEEAAMGGGEGKEREDAEGEGGQKGADDDDGDLTPPPPDSQLVDPRSVDPPPPPGHGVKPVGKSQKPKKPTGKRSTTYLMHHATLGDMILSPKMDFTSWAKRVGLVPGSQGDDGRVWYNGKPGGGVNLVVDDLPGYRTFIGVVAKMGVVELHPGRPDDYDG